ncbi:MAG: aminotransferase class I/II-fold pyridoxal phosphate-dependent enzyme, partial [Rhodothermia bacterium]|nr:aminotransferase class I/II-fold pyridoxal phosphate-dependent enzyme [Rhodothermia bacterium]
MSKSIETKLIHAGEPNPRVDGAVAMPIFQSAMFEYAGPEDEVRYIRYSNNPNQVALQEKLAALENAEAAIVTSSGMAAISSALLSILQPGDHLLAQNCLYGGTHKLATTLLSDLDITVDFIDASEPASWKNVLRPRTKAVYVETITNPLIEVGELEAVSEFARSHGLISLIDNTFASPINFRPSEWGFDISIHSATKYLNGHSDIVA